MFLLFVAGVLGGVLILWWPLRRARREVIRLDELQMQIVQDRQRRVDFMRHIVEALGEGLHRPALLQRIVQASALCTGASSACFFEQTANSTLRGAAVEGLFPPHRPLNELSRAPATSATTRAKLIEQVLRPEELPVGEGLIGRVAQTGKGELMTDASADPGVVKHEDPVLVMRSVIAMPVFFREQFFGVLAVANPVGDRPFTEMDFSLMQSFAEQASLALRHAELLQGQPGQV
jgi:phosphoserine phosphatase RsbU/P